MAAGGHRNLTLAEREGKGKEPKVSFNSDDAVIRVKAPLYEPLFDPQDLSESKKRSKLVRANRKAFHDLVILIGIHWHFG
jgi:hypothetical protein